MKNYILLMPVCMVALIMTGSFLSCEKPTTTVANATATGINYAADSTRLRYLKEVEWPKAYAEQDTVLLDRILGDDFRLIDQDGGWYTKQDELNWIKKNATKHDSFRYEIRRLDILPNGTAVIAGTGHIINDGNTSIYQSSNVLVYREGAWKAIVSHVSGIQEQK